ncbi:MAG: metallophosphoesterase [Myxococcota bacterium]
MWRMVIFFLVFIVVWGGGHAYAGWTLTRHGDPTRAWRVAVWSLLGFNFAASAAAFVGRRFATGEVLVDLLQFVAYVGMGAFAMLFALLVLRDVLELALIGAFRFKTALAASGAAAEAVESPERREFFGQIANIGMLGAAATGASVGYWKARKIPDIQRVEVPVEGLHPDLDGFRIAQVSDVHVGPTIKGEFLEGVVERVNTLGADLVAFTGDMVDGYVDDMREDTRHIGNFQATHGSYFVTGNHEYYWDAPAWCDEVERCGMKVLNNANELVRHGGATLAVGGVTDYRAARHDEAQASDPHRAIEGAEDADFKLLLAHQPKSIYEAAKAGFDLQLSGHTHGGQFWPWNLVVGLAHPFTAGLDVFESMMIYVSRGTGYWGPPMRLGAPSEITLLTLKRV